MNKNLIILALVVVVALVGGYYLLKSSKTAVEETAQTPTTNVENNEASGTIENDTPASTPTVGTGGSSSVVVAKKIRVLSPNGGGTWLRNKPYVVRWDTTLPVSTRVYVDLIPTNTVITSPYVNAKRIAGQEMFHSSIFPQGLPNEGSFQYTVPSDVKTGTYQVLILAGKDCNSPEAGERCDYDFSDGVFTIK